MYYMIAGHERLTKSKQTKNLSEERNVLHGHVTSDFTLCMAANLHPKTF